MGVKVSKPKQETTAPVANQAHAATSAPAAAVPAKGPAEQHVTAPSKAPTTSTSATTAPAPSKATHGKRGFVVDVKEVCEAALGKLDKGDTAAFSTDVVHLESLLTKVKPRRLDIVQFNDVYNLDSTSSEEPIGGAARFATVLEDLRKELAKKGFGAPLVIFCGDFVGPSLMSSITHGAHLIDCFNYLNVHYGTFGNHEFDYGYTSLLNRLAGVDDDVTDADVGFHDYPETQTKWIATNLTEGATGLPIGGKYAQKTALFRWGAPDAEITIGVLGVSENWVDECMQLKPNEIVYEDYIKSARAAAVQLRANGAELVLAICHNRLAGDRELTAQVPEIDLVLGGHDHFYKHDRKNRLVKSGEEWRWLTHVRIELSPNKSFDVSVERYDVDGEVIPDPKFADICLKYKTLADRKFAKVIAHTTVAMDPRESVVRFKEGTLPSFICDACAEDYSQAEGLQSADFALLSGYTFAGKEEIPAGNFTLGDLMTVLPRPATLVVVKLRGSDVIKTLQVGAKKLPEECGGLFHVSHRLKYTIVIHGVASFDQATGKIPKPTVENVLFDGKPIDPNFEYTVAVSDGTATGLFGLGWFKTAERVVKEEVAHQIADVAVWYCERRVGVDINPSLGRITIIRE